MKIKKFCDYEDFVYQISDKVDLFRKIDGYNDISIIAKYKDAKEIIKELLYIGYDIASIHLGKENYEEYWDEYIISMVNTNGNAEVWCEPFKRKNGYITDDSTVIYILDNCSSKVIPYCNGNIVYEVNILDEDDCDDNCNDDECTCDECHKISIFEKLLKFPWM